VSLPKGVSYRPGDHLCVVPRNRLDLVERVEKRFGFAPGARIKLKTTGGRMAPFPIEGPVSVRRILTDYMELQAPATRKQVQAMAAATRCPMTKPKLEALGADAEGWRRSLPRRSAAQTPLGAGPVLRSNLACELTFPAYLEMLARHGAALLLDLVIAKHHAGLNAPSQSASSKDAARSGRGDYRGDLFDLSGRQGCRATPSFASIKETKAGFRLPDDPSVPVIMIGPGTGLAPFRAFLQERVMQKGAGGDLGPAILFFGCRHPDQDFLYRKELEAMDKEGIADLHVAFSRHDGKKDYVQDLILKERKKVWELIEAGARIYICGDGSRMEPDVKRALTRIYAEEKDVDPAEADAWMERMGVEGRYALDVWAGG
jgi:cytochrome P450/NADPH-cytochrome P450 reductase